MCKDTNIYLVGTLKQQIKWTHDYVNFMQQVLGYHKQFMLFVGTMGYESEPAVNELEKGCLYKLDKDKEIHTMVEGVSISNGLAWTADNTVMYYIDSIPRHVYAYDFDQASGSICMFEINRA